MTDAATIRINPKDYRLDGRLFRRIVKLLKPYWGQKRHWKSWVLMVFTVAIGPVWAYYNFRVAELTSTQANALVGKDETQWKWLFWLLFLLQFGRWIYNALLGALTYLLQVHWYRWMTDWMVGRYLRNKTYYDISMKTDVDNPDERIQTNVEPLSSPSSGFPRKCWQPFWRSPPTACW